MARRNGKSLLIAVILLAHLCVPMHRTNQWVAGGRGGHSDAALGVLWQALPALGRPPLG